MANNLKKYEGMFLIDAGNPDFQAANEPVRNILTRYGAEILSIKPWDERKLAYEIKGRKRGLYVLVYFQCDPLKIVEIEHDCELDERVLRQLILRKDKLTQEVIDKDTPAISGVKPEDAAEPAPLASPITAIEDVPDVTADANK